MKLERKLFAKKDYEGLSKEEAKRLKEYRNSLANKLRDERKRINRERKNQLDTIIEDAERSRKKYVIDNKRNNDKTTKQILDDISDIEKSKIKKANEVASLERKKAMKSINKLSNDFKKRISSNKKKATIVESKDGLKKYLNGKTLLVSGSILGGIVGSKYILDQYNTKKDIDKVKKRVLSDEN